MVVDVGEHSNWFWNRRSSESIRDRQAKERLKWADGRAVFRMPETTDEQLEQMRFVRTPEERQAFNIALRGVLNELASPEQRKRRLQHARQFDERNAARILANAARLFKAGEMDQETLTQEFVADMSFYAVAPSEAKTASKVEESLSAERNSEEQREMRVYSWSGWLPKESSVDRVEYVEARGDRILVAQEKLGCGLTIDHGQKHELTLPPPAGE